MDYGVEKLMRPILFEDDSEQKQQPEVAKKSKPMQQVYNEMRYSARVYEVGGYKAIREQQKGSKVWNGHSWG